MAISKKLNPQELLSKLVTSKSSGCLKLSNGKIDWKIYLQQGNLKYIDCSVQLLEQLEYYLHYLGLREAVMVLKQWSALDTVRPVNLEETTPNTYSKAISLLLSEKYLSIPQAVKLIHHITEEALQYCIWIDKDVSHWHKGESIPQWIDAKLGNFPPLDLAKSLSLAQSKLKQWQSCSDKLFSVHQRLYFVSDWEKKELPLFGLLDRQALKQLAKIANGRISIRQLSLLLKKHELDVAQMLSPYIDERIIHLRSPQPALLQFPTIPRLDDNSYQSSSINKIYKIVCIDDSPTILKEIKRFLEEETFQVTIIDDPTQAVSKIFTINPDLILLDINMPRINGYELCKLLKKSGKCDLIPIIMVTGNNGLIDRARAKIAGARDYCTKPFTKSELVELIKKYLN